MFYKCYCHEYNKLSNIWNNSSDTEFELTHDHDTDEYSDYYDYVNSYGAGYDTDDYFYQ